jgi:hypothetical protein
VYTFKIQCNIVDFLSHLYGSWITNSMTGRIREVASKLMSMII